MAARFLVGLIVGSVAFTAVAQAQAPADGAKPRQTLSCSTAGGEARKPARCHPQVTAQVKDGACPARLIDAPHVALSGSRHARIVWHLEPGFEFCPAQGDGVFLKTTGDAQFGNAAATSMETGDDDDAPAPAGRCTRHFRLDNTNAPQTAGKQYDYTVRFHDKKTGAACVLDPFIRNG
jgi:hypothetical protein